MLVATGPLMTESQPPAGSSSLETTPLPSGRKRNSCGSRRVPPVTRAAQAARVADMDAVHVHVVERQRAADGEDGAGAPERPGGGDGISCEVHVDRRGARVLPGERIGHHQRDVVGALAVGGREGDSQREEVITGDLVAVRAVVVHRGRGGAPEGGEVRRDGHALAHRILRRGVAAAVTTAVAVQGRTDRVAVQRSEGHSPAREVDAPVHTRRPGAGRHETALAEGHGVGAHGQVVRSGGQRAVAPVEREAVGGEPVAGWRDLAEGERAEQPVPVVIVASHQRSGGVVQTNLGVAADRDGGPRIKPGVRRIGDGMADREALYHMCAGRPPGCSRQSKRSPTRW